MVSSGEETKRVMNREPKRWKRRLWGYALVVLVVALLFWPGFFVGERLAVSRCNAYYQGVLSDLAEEQDGGGVGSGLDENIFNVTGWVVE